MVPDDLVQAHAVRLHAAEERPGGEGVAERADRGLIAIPQATEGSEVDHAGGRETGQVEKARPGLLAAGRRGAVAASSAMLMSSTAAAVLCVSSTISSVPVTPPASSLR